MTIGDGNIMNEFQKNTVLSLFIRSVKAIMEEKRNNPKSLKKLNKFKAKINFGLEIEKDEYLWFNYISDNGKITVNKGRLEDDYDLEVMSVPEDFMFFVNGENSLLHMLLKRNKFRKRKFKFGKGTTGRNLRKLIKLPSIFVMDKIKPEIS
ncbi:MAG: hypothetical protein ACTSQI_15440 [Candidatus Helarchaeota archaeon]